MGTFVMFAFWIFLVVVVANIPYHWNAEVAKPWLIIFGSFAYFLFGFATAVMYLWPLFLIIMIVCIIFITNIKQQRK